MALARAWAIGLVGIDGHVVEVEADLAQGLPGLTIIGLPDTALSESRDRVRAAVLNSQEPWPQRRITLGLSPATLPKRGSAFDLAMACAVLAADRRMPAGALEGLVLVGELGLDGRVRPVRGVLPAALAAARAGFERIVVPQANVAEAALVPDIGVVGVASLRGLLARLRGEPDDENAAPAAPEGQAGAAGTAAPPSPDLGDVLGQATGRRAIEIAAAGGHHVFLLGNPGTGKTMLAARLPGVLPDLDREAALEVTAVHSVAGTLPDACPLITRPPYRDPHHTTSVAALVGGGSGVARPGAVSLAHRGVLFLDEAPEFASGVLDCLRQPLESGRVTISRAGGTATYPARFTLVLAANRCPCSSASADPVACSCSANSRRRYLAKLSGPLLDRVDLRVETMPVSRAELLADRGCAEPSDLVRKRVTAAREGALARFSGTPWRTNAEVPGRELRGRWRLPRAVLASPERALDQGLLSARGLDRVLRVAWTIADLAGRMVPNKGDVDEAFGLRIGKASEAAA